MGVALNPGTGSLSDTEEERRGHRGEATWRRRWRREGGGHQPRDGRLGPPEAGRGGEDPPLEPLQGGQPWEPLTTDVWSLGLRVWGGMDVCGLKPQVSSVTTDTGSSRRLRQPQVLLDDGCS